MKRTVLINGMAVAYRFQDGRLYFEFMPDDPRQQVVEPSQTKGSAQLMRDGGFCFTEAKKRIRNNDLLICKAPHGRLSGTRDHAWQLTLKAFESEGIDWQRAFVCETIDLMTKVTGRERMMALLEEMLCLTKIEDLCQIALDKKGK